MKLSPKVEFPLLILLAVALAAALLYTIRVIFK